MYVVFVYVLRASEAKQRGGGGGVEVGFWWRSKRYRFLHGQRDGSLDIDGILNEDCVCLFVFLSFRLLRESATVGGVDCTVSTALVAKVVVDWVMTLPCPWMRPEDGSRDWTEQTEYAGAD